jgi:hypothetical protein
MITSLSRNEKNAEQLPDPTGKLGNASYKTAISVQTEGCLYGVLQL